MVWWMVREKSLISDAIEYLNAHEKHVGEGLIRFQLDAKVRAPLSPSLGICWVGLRLCSAWCQRAEREIANLRVAEHERFMNEVGQPDERRPIQFPAIRT